MELEILNNKTEKIKIDSKIFGEGQNNDLVAQVLNVYMSNQRKGNADAKTRGEVQGGGRKPWKQKGTGRARQGSIRSPLWYKGGVTFGPSTETNWKRGINSKMNRKAIKVVLSQKQKENKLFAFDFTEIKTKKDIRNTILNYLKEGVVISNNTEVKLSLRNVKNVEVINASNINIFNLLKAHVIILDKDVLKLIEDNLSK